MPALCNMLEIIYIGQNDAEVLCLFNIQHTTKHCAWSGTRQTSIYGILIKDLHQFSAGLFGRKSAYESHGCGFESHYGQEYFILHFSFTSRSLKLHWTNKMKSSMTIIWGKRSTDLGTQTILKKTAA